ncbi:adenylate/guanylate cyclase domain-containing protein, partial [Acinetobacter baumannii]
EALRVAQDASSYVVKSSGANLVESFGVRSGIVAVKTGDLQVQTDARGRLILYDSGHRGERYVSAKAVLTDQAPREKIENNVIFIGTSAIG